MNGQIIETEFLVVGAGPAGASLSCFLARYGLKGLMISAASGTSQEPRAHITNLTTLDAFRDIGIADDCYKLGRTGKDMMHLRWSETIGSEEYGRVFSWGNDPKRKGDYVAASPNPGLLDLPQSEMEPLLIRFATANGFKVRFDTQLLSFSRDSVSGKITSLLKDLLTAVEYTVVSNFLFGADGGRSTVVPGAGLHMNFGQGGGVSYNVIVRCDLSHVMHNVRGNLQWNLRLKSNDHKPYMLRMVKPWNVWVAGIMPRARNATIEPDPEVVKQAFREIAQDPHAEVEILDISKWRINEAWADRFSQDNIICLGDAVHRHPPSNGLGSNTCVGDAFNLAWKVDLVSKGVAHPSLLESYTQERQPVAAELVRLANYHLRKQVVVLQLLGVDGEPDYVANVLDLPGQDSKQGREYRQTLQSYIDDMAHETHALGLEMGQKYFGAGIYDADEIGVWKATGREAEDPVLYYEPTTYPGKRLPHVWLSKRTPSELVSTCDVAGQGHFCLFTGVGGAKWKDAAAQVGKELNLPIKAVSIGPKQDWEDPYFGWTKVRGVAEDGAVLCRPDLFCAWRSQEPFADSSTCAVKLREVVKSILGWNQDRKMQPFQDRLADYGPPSTAAAAITT